MLNEPDLQLANALRVVTETYGLDITQATFIPRGEVAWCYKLIDRRGRAFLLRITMDVALPILSDLEKLQDLDFVIKPIDNVFRKYKGYSLSLYDFIGGETMLDMPPDAAQMEVAGQCFAQLHQTSQRCGPFERQETFTLDFKQDYQTCLERLTKGQPSKDNAAFSLQKKLTPFLDFIQGEYEKLRAHQQAIGARAVPFVNCHGDPSPQNLIFEGARMYLIDLEDLVYAPKEQDLLYFSDHVHFEKFMQGYRNIDPHAELDGNLRAWYGRNWFLGEVTDNCQEILCHPHTENEYAHYLQQIDEVLEDVGLL